MRSDFSIIKDKSVGFALWQVTTLWQRKIKAELEKVDLSHSGFVILASLLWLEGQGGDITQTTIIEYTKLDKMTVSKSLKILEQKSLIVRRENSKDSRAKSIVFTEKGRNQTIQSVKIVEEVDRHFFSPLQNEEKDKLLTLFHILKEH